MKLRINDNSIRLRLSRSEVSRLAQDESIEGRTNLIPEPFAYQLSAAKDRVTPSATFQRGTLRIVMPSPLVEEWAHTNQVGIEATIPNPHSADDAVHLLIEKDFQCLHGPAENQEDCFANPMAERQS